MKRPAIAFALLLLLVGAAAASAGTDPHAERVRLNAADTAFARRITLHRADLTPGWKQVASPSDDGERLSCSYFDPDFSAFTITGKATTSFSHPSGGTVVSRIEVYASRADAVGDFRLGARPAGVRCLRTSLARELAGPASNGVKMTVRTSRMLAAPHVGERSIAFRIVAEIGTRAQHVPIYLDVLAAQRGRSITMLLFAALNRPITGQATLARLVDTRAR